jgi:DNA-binding response OmpR family regulator
MESTGTSQTNALGRGTPIQVLLVEDDPESAFLTRSQVSEDSGTQFQVEWNDNLETAMSRLAKPGVDVVLLDLGMQGLSGYRTHLAIASAIRKTIPVVILTSDDSAISHNITIGLGAASYLVKPRASSVEIRHALHEAVDQWQRHPVFE